MAMKTTDIITTIPFSPSPLARLLILKYLNGESIFRKLRLLLISVSLAIIYANNNTLVASEPEDFGFLIIVAKTAPSATNIS